jgi:hypothetical protein
METAGMNPPPTSNCHNAPVQVASSDEGTSYYVCAECRQPCDIQPNPFQNGNRSPGVPESGEANFMPGLEPFPSVNDPHPTEIPQNNKDVLFSQPTEPTELDCPDCRNLGWKQPCGTCLNTGKVTPEQYRQFTGTPEPIATGEVERRLIELGLAVPGPEMDMLLALIAQQRRQAVNETLVRVWSGDLSSYSTVKETVEALMREVNIVENDERYVIRDRLAALKENTHE